MRFHPDISRRRACAVAPITSRPTPPGKISTPSTAACATCSRIICRLPTSRTWSRISTGSAALAGGRLDELARQADKHPPVLHPRDRFGRDEDWIDYHASYREMEQIAFGDFQFHAMSHRAGALGIDRPLPAVAKYALQYLFVQAEFGLMCPISVTDTSTHLIRKFASPELQAYLLPKMLSGDVATMWKGTQFMTERAGGSDVGTIETSARLEDGEWRLSGDKWFCSHADADVALLLARPEGAPSGTKGLALFAMPRRLKDGRRNSYRIVRLKDKLGTRSMASGEILLEGAVAYLVGAQDQGLKQMMEQVNLSRLSHGVRAAAMMRRCVNEAMVCARTRQAFGHTIIDYPLLRRQLLKITLPAEQSLSMFLFAADAMDRANAGDNDARNILRILTPLLKFRACRDNIPVATGAMEVRGGNGYIEEWVHARLVRDAHIGVLWEGTSNINALDIITRAVGKSRAHEALQAALLELLDQAASIPLRLQRSPAAGAGSCGCVCRSRRRRGCAGNACAPGRQRALSHHQRDPDDLGSGKARAPMRDARCTHGWCWSIG